MAQEVDRTKIIEAGYGNLSTSLVKLLEEVNTQPSYAPQMRVPLGPPAQLHAPQARMGHVYHEGTCGKANESNLMATQPAFFAAKEIGRCRSDRHAWVIVALSLQAGGGASCFGDAPTIFEEAKASAQSRLTIEGAICIAAAACVDQAEVGVRRLVSVVQFAWLSQSAFLPCHVLCQLCLVGWLRCIRMWVAAWLQLQTLSFCARGAANPLLVVAQLGSQLPTHCSSTR